MQGLVKIYKEFGNGDISIGRSLLYAIAGRLEHARTNHPKSERDNMHEFDAFCALDNEKEEVLKAIKHETPQRVADELLDVISVAVRMLNEEYKQ